MKTILFVDTFCGYGHDNINRIYINSFIKQGYDVHLAMRKSYFETLDLNPELLKIELPDKYFNENCSFLVAKLNQIKVIKFVKSNILKKNYNFHFFSYFEEISFYFSGFRGKVFLMVHGNTENLDSPVKCFFLKKISKLKNLNFLVFSENFKFKFLEKNIHNVVVSPHGCPEPINLRNTDFGLKKLLTDLNCSYLTAKIIFVPNGNKFRDDSIDKLLVDKSFIEFIAENDLILIIKGAYINTISDRVYFLPPYVDKFYFDLLLLKCCILLLNYPTSFQFRVSGIFFQGIANNKPMILTNIYSFNQYENIFNYNPFYHNVSELINVIKYLILVDGSFFPYKNLDILEPKLIN